MDPENRSSSPVAYKITHRNILTQAFAYFEAHKFASKSRNIKYCLVASKLIGKLKSKSERLLNVILERVYDSIEENMRKSDFINVFECLRSLLVCHDQILERAIGWLQRSQLELRVEERLRLRFILALVGYDGKNEEQIKKLEISKDELVVFLDTEEIEWGAKINALWAQLAFNIRLQINDQSIIKAESIKQRIAQLLENIPTAGLSNNTQIMLKQLFEYSDSILEISLTETSKQSYISLINHLNSSLNNEFIKAFPNAIPFKGSQATQPVNLDSKPLFCYIHPETQKPVVYQNSNLSTYDRTAANGFMKVEYAMWYKDGIDTIYDWQLNKKI